MRVDDVAGSNFVFLTDIDDVAWCVQLHAATLAEVHALQLRGAQRTSALPAQRPATHCSPRTRVALY